MDQKEPLRRQPEQESGLRRVISLRLLRRGLGLGDLLQPLIPARFILVAFEVASGLLEFFRLRQILNHLFDSLLKIATLITAIRS